MPSSPACTAISWPLSKSTSDRVSGKPLAEPVAWYGPIVMNTQEQLRQAFTELEKGTFLKEGKRS